MSVRTGATKSKKQSLTRCSLFGSLDLIDRLLQRHRETLAPLVWPEFEGRRGNPILFDSSLFSELRQVRGDTGGKPVLLRYQDRAERVAVSDKSILQDFDHPEDLATTEFNVQSSRFKG